MIFCQKIESTPRSSKTTSKNALEEFYWALQYFYGKCYSESCLNILKLIKPILQDKTIFCLSQKKRTSAFQFLENLTYAYDENAIPYHLESLVDESICFNPAFNGIILGHGKRLKDNDFKYLFSALDHIVDVYKSFMAHNITEEMPLNMGIIACLMQMLVLSEKYILSYKANGLSDQNRPRRISAILAGIYKSDSTEHDWSGHLIVQLFAYLLYAKNKLKNKDFDKCLALVEKIFTLQSELSQSHPFVENFRFGKAYELLDTYFRMPVPEDAVKKAIQDFKETDIL